MSNIPIYLTPTGALNVRSGPGTQHDIIGLVRPDDSLQILEPPKEALAKLGEIGEWIKVRIPNGKEGFSAAWYLELQTTELILTPTGNGLRVRETPRTGRQVASVNMGDKVKSLDLPETVLQKLGVVGEWLHVSAPGGIEGWSAAWFLDFYQGQEVPQSGGLVYSRLS